MIEKMPLDCLISLNSKLESLCGLLYEIGFILLQGFFSFWFRFSKTKNATEFQNKPDDIAINDVRHDLKSLAKVKNEINNFQEVMQIYDSAARYFKDCVAAYHVIQNRSERKGFCPAEFQRLEYLVRKCRLLVNNIDEEYRIYEESVSLSEKRCSENESENEYEHGKRKEPKIKQSIFEKLSGTRSASSRKIARASETGADYEKNLEQAISINLQKIFPQKSGFKPAIVLGLSSA